MRYCEREERSFPDNEFYLETDDDGSRVWIHNTSPPHTAGGVDAIMIASGEWIIQRGSLDQPAALTLNPPPE
jgi:hypothetical protein